MRLKRGIWVGAEVEGPHVGLRTIFVMGVVPWAQIDQVIHECLDPHIPAQTGIYFGAGRCPDFDPGAIVEAVSHGYKPITVEVRGCITQVFADLDPKTLQEVELVRVYTEEHLWWTEGFDRVKIEGLDELQNTVLMFGPRQKIAADLSQPLVPGDKLLWAEEEVEDL